MVPLVVEFDPVFFGSRTRNSDIVTIRWSQSVLLRVCVAGPIGLGVVELRRAVRGTKESVLVANVSTFAVAATGGALNCEEKWVLLDIANPIVELPGQYFLRAKGDVPLTWIRGELQYDLDDEIPPGPIGDDGDTGIPPFPDPEPDPDPEPAPTPTPARGAIVTTVAVGVGAALLTAVVMAATIGRREP